jgi:hypothetical protein
VAGYFTVWEAYILNCDITHSPVHFVLIWNLTQSDIRLEFDFTYIGEFSWKVSLFRHLKFTSYMPLSLFFVVWLLGSSDLI